MYRQSVHTIWLQTVSGSDGQNTLQVGVGFTCLITLRLGRTYPIFSPEHLITSDSHAPQEI